MRSLLICAALLAAACSGSAEDKKADAAPVEQTGTESTDTSDKPAADDEAKPEVAAEVAAPAMNLDEVEDLETLFEVKGNVDKSQVAGIIGQRKPDIHKCYGDALAANPGMTGRVLVQITTAANGSVASAMIKQTTLKKPVVEQCMVGKIRGWKFPNDNSGGLVVIKYAFQLPP